jgi:hypothetical protein
MMAPDLRDFAYTNELPNMDVCSCEERASNIANMVTWLGDDKFNLHERDQGVEYGDCQPFSALFAA